MFTDRKDGGEKLGRALEQYGGPDTLVLGIPRGGLETAYYVAKHLQADLDLVVARKLGYPSNPEAAFGAVAEDGSTYISNEGSEILTDDEIGEVVYRERLEMERRVKKFRGGNPLPPMERRTVIIVDDGIATGATLFATISLCKKKKAAKIVVASPISGRHIETVLKKLVDDVVILETPILYNAVSQGYRAFENLTDDEALSFVNRWKNEHHS